jgi:dihydrodipicolinate synthase/N-acetylneuraminate lyase
VLPNLVPGKCVEFYNALRSGKAEKAGEIMAFLFKLVPLMTVTPTPHAIMKEAMRQLGHPGPTRYGSSRRLARIAP